MRCCCGLCLWLPPERLYALSRQGFDASGKSRSWDGWTYPDFALMRAAAKNEAELIAVSYTDRMDLTYVTDEEMEKGYVQYVSGWMFDSLGLRLALGRLLTKEDDRTPGAHPYAVLSYDYRRALAWLGVLVGLVPQVDCG